MILQYMLVLFESHIWTLISGIYYSVFIITPIMHNYHLIVAIEIRNALLDMQTRY
jgi:hypothetical protein